MLHGHGGMTLEWMGGNGLFQGRRPREYRLLFEIVTEYPVHVIIVIVPTPGTSVFVNAQANRRVGMP